MTVPKVYRWTKMSLMMHCKLCYESYPVQKFSQDFTFLTVRATEEWNELTPEILTLFVTLAVEREEAEKSSE